MGHGEVLSLPVCKPLYTGNRSEASRSYSVQSLNQATPKLQRILIRTFPYHFTVCYIPGVTNHLANCLSRLGGQKDTIKLPRLYLYQITNQLCTRSESLNQLRVSMQADDELALLKHTIMQGWPSSIKQLPQVLQPYWTFREELTVEDGLILKGTRIVIPAKKHEAVLKQIHEGHLGLNKCKLHAKDTVYWPGLNGQLEKLVLKYEVCLRYSHSKCKQEPNLSLGPEVPLYPWTKLATDIFHFEGASYLLVVDYTSRFQIVCKLMSMTGQHIASQCKLIFSKYGWPESFISDNEPCYTAEVLPNLMREYSVNHITRSPHYPQSNEMGLLKNMSRLSRTCFIRLKKKGNTCSNVNGVLQYPFVKQLVLNNANLVKQIGKIRPYHVKCSQKTIWTRLWGLEKQV